MAATDVSVDAVASAPRRAAEAVPAAPMRAPSPVSPRAPRLRAALAQLGWSLASLGLFAGLWEGLWALGLLNPLLLPPPHLFLADLPGTLAYFDRANRIGSRGGGGGVMPLLATIGWTTLRVTVGLVLGFVGGVLVGALLHYVRLFRNLVLPTVLLLAPISPVAWLPVAIFVFGIGDVPAIFLVFITLFFAIALTTSAQIAAVPVTYLNVARIMGADARQTFFRVVLPAILPGLFMTLRLNLFAAWMVVLIAEAVGVGSGLGQIVSLARSTFNARLSFFTMAIIGLLGFGFDWALRQVQARMLWWIAPQGGGR